MLSKRKQGSGLDISGVGRRRMNLPGGNLKSRSGLDISASASASAGKRGAGSGRRRAGYVGHEGGKTRRPRKALLIALAVAVGAVLLATAVGYAVYQQVMQNSLKPDLDSQALSGVLVAPDSSEEATWNVVLETDATSAEVGRGQIEDIALVYFDPENKSASFLWLTTDTRVYLDGYGYQTVADAFALQGETGLTSSLAKLGNVSVAHYIEFNERGLSRFAETLAPLDANVEADDKEAVAQAFCKKLFGLSSGQVSQVAESFVACAATDMTADAAATFFTSMQGLDADSGLFQADEPVTTETSGGSTYTSVDTDSWTTMIARVETGLSPVASKKELAEYESMRSSSTVDIWNGVGVSGIASDCSKELKKLGWNIGKTGNAAQFVYSETLVVYNANKNRELAELVVSDLGQGRVVMGAARYSFTGDVLVVLGSDYRPY